MSTISGIGSKGEKNKSKYKGIDINTLYKGKSVETQKSAVPRQHGLQSLGKVSSLRRMPPPANLPSLKSENSGNDPSVSLVPSGGSGWGAKEEKKEGTGGGSQPPSSQLPQGTPAPAQAPPTQQQAQAATKTSIPSGGQNSTGVRSWSTITGGVQQGGLVSHQSPLFQEEFPSLAQEEKNKEQAQPTKKEDEIKDTQYGPGPSLRPQNVASWREGGGRAVPQPKPEESTANLPNSNQTETQPNGHQMSGGGGSGPGSVGEGHSPPPVGPPRPGSGHGLPPSAMPMGPHMGMPPPHHPQYRGMMPPYMFGRPPHGGYPPNYPGFARPAFPDPRFRGPPPPSMQRHRGDGEELQKRPAIVSEKQLNDFDELLKTDTNETGWAGPQGEIDYSEKLVFSDDEDDSKSPRDKMRSDERRRERELEYSRDLRDPGEANDKDGGRDIERKEDREKDDQGPMMVREAWPHGPPRYRGGPRPPHPGMDARGWPPHMHPYDFMGPRGAPPYAFRMPPPQMRPPYGPPPPPVSSPGAMPARKQGEDEDEVWSMKRRANEGEINSAIGRARQRREEEEKRKDSELKAAAAEKLRQLDERSKKKDEGKDSDADRRSSRTASESSDKDSLDNRHKDRPSNYNAPQGDHAGSKNYARQVPPRFQKQEALMGAPPSQRQQPPSPGAGGPPTGPMPQGFRPRQGHPPPPWGPYDPRWGHIPHFMDPRYGPRPPLDMQGMPMYGPPMPARRRHDSQDGSGNDRPDSEGRHPDQFDRPDPRTQWMERGYPHPGHFEEMRRYPYMDQRAAYAERYDFEPRDYDRHDEDHLSGHSEPEKPHKEPEQRPPALLRHDSFEDRGKGFMEKEERKSERSNSKNSSDWEQKPYKDSKDESFDQFDDEFGEKVGKENLPEEEPEEPYPARGYRRDGRQGPTPTFRPFTSDERSRREASAKNEGNGSSNGPPPLLDAKPSKPSLTSLKRSASNMSSSSAASSDKDRERKSDSPKESLIFERSNLPKKDLVSKQDPLKDNKGQSKNSQQPTEPARPNAWEIKEQDRAKSTKEKEKPEVIPFPKDEEVEKEFERERVDSPFNNRPPLKKKREDEQGDKERRDYDDHDRRDRDRDQDRYDRGDRNRVASSRGREFVRGRGNSRSRGRGSARGAGGSGSGRYDGSRSSRNKDFYPINYERNQGGGRGQRRVERQPLMKPDSWKSDESDENDYPKSKHGMKGEEGNDNKEDWNKELKDNTPKDRERRDRREPLLPTRMDRERNDGGPRDQMNSWNRERDKNSLVAAPPPPQNPWNRESKPLLPLPTSRVEWGSSEASSKEDTSGDSRNSWNQRQGGGFNESGPEKLVGGSHDNDLNDGRNRRQDNRDRDNRRDDRDRDNRRRQDREGGGRRGERGDDALDVNDKEAGGKERFDRNSKDRDRDRRNKDRDGGPDLRQDGQGNTYVPRGEPSRRGRGGARGGRGGRYMSAPAGRGGGGSGGSQRIESFNSQNGSSTNGRNLSGRGDRDGRTNNYEGSNYRRDPRRQDNRNQPPPRFTRTNATSEARGRGNDRGSGGRGRSSKGRGASAPAHLAKKPVLTKQASNDGEEWETASESSEPKNDPRESRDNRKENSIKKNSNQRQFNNDRQQNSRPRMNNQDSRNSVERRNSNKDKNPKNGVAPPTKSAANENGTTNTTPKPPAVSAANHKENVVYRVDGVVPSDPNAINNAINSLHTKKQNVKKSPEISEPSKPVKTEKEKKDALANIDINNYASVVVIDDQPEVTTDDPNFIFETNEGFQEVTSKKTLKTKQKLIEAEQKKTEKDSQKKKDHSNKVVARPKGLSPKTGRVGVKGSKLPPRLAKQKEQREKEKEMCKNVMPKIELWDNELANNIPTSLEIGGNNSATASSSNADISIDDVADMSVPSTTIVINAKTSLSSMTVAPAPTPTTNAWSKPFRFSAAVGQPNQNSKIASQQQHAVVVVANPKHDKGDQHDSGIDVSDHQPNSASSSTRSSPSADNKLITNTLPSSPGSSSGLKRPEEVVRMDIPHPNVELPKPQRTSKVVKTEKNATPETTPSEINTEAILTKDISDNKPEPIQMPPSFKDSIFGKSEGSALQLDFNYDESLADHTVIHDKVETASVHTEEPHLPVSGPIVSPTSPTTEDWSSKIASKIKNFWDPLPPPFEPSNIASSSCVTSSDSLPANNNSNASPAGPGTPSYHHSFGRDVGNVVNVSVGVMNNETPSPSQLEDDMSVTMSAGSVPVVKTAHSPSLHRMQHSPHPAEKSMMSEVEVTAVQGMVVSDHHDEKVPMLEPTNVCKVRPQQLQVGGVGEISASALASAMTGSLPTVASPPILLTNQPAFQMPQYVPQEQRYTQPSFGFSLTPTQGPAGLGGQHQPQQTFSQGSFIVPSTPTQPTELFPSSPMAFPQRNPGFAPTAAPAAPAPPAQPSTIMVSSASSSLMSSNLKAQGPSHGAGPQGLASTFSADPLGKNLGHSQIYSGLGSTSLPGAPSQQLFYYDPHPQALSQLFQPAHSQLIGGSQSSQNLNNSQIIGSQLLQTRTPVQANSSFFQPAQGVSYFQTQPSSVQVGGPIQQVTSGHQFPVQAAFGSQTHGLGLTLQPAGPATLDSGPPQAPGSMTLHHSQPIGHGHTGHGAHGHGLQPTQQHTLGSIPASAANKASHFGNVVAAAPQQPHQQQQHHPHHPSHHHHHHSSNPPQHLGGPSQPQLQQHAHGSSRSNQMKSLSHSTTPANVFNVGMSSGTHTFTQGHSSVKPMSSGGSMNHGVGMPSNSSMGMGSTSGATNMKGSANNSMSLHHPPHHHHGGDGNSMSSMSSRMPLASTPSSFSSMPSNMNQSQQQQLPTSSMPPSNVSARSGGGVTHSRFPNPNAPNFPPSNKYSSGGINKPNTPPTSQPIQSGANSYSSQAPPHSTGNNNVRPQMMMGNMLRGNAPMQGPSNPRPPFPTPIQRPGSPSTSGGPRPPSSMMGGPGPGPNQNMNKPPQNMGPPSGPPGPQGNPGPLNLGNSTFLSNMILNAASVISQTVGSQLGLHQGGPPNPNNPFSNKGGPFGMGGGPPAGNRDGPPPQQGGRPGSGPPSHPNAKPSGPPSSQSYHQSNSSHKPPGSYPGPPGANNASNLKAQQAQQRQALLTHAANFLNSNKSGGNKPTGPPKPPVTSTTMLQHSASSKTDEKKPPLPMVSNPGLVGTSVKIDFSASNNSRAPAVSANSTATVNSSSTSVNADIQLSGTSEGPSKK